MSLPDTFFLNVEIYARTHPTILFSIAIAGVLLLILLRLKEINKKRSQEVPIEKKESHVITSQDIKSIAGDNVMATQLDLARAYIEMDKKTLAKKILDHVITHGNEAQQQEAQQLIDKLL